MECREINQNPKNTSLTSTELLPQMLLLRELYLDTTENEQLVPSECDAGHHTMKTGYR